MSHHINSLAEFVASGAPHDNKQKVRFISFANGLYAMVIHPDPTVDQFSVFAYEKDSKGRLSRKRWLYTDSNDALYKATNIEAIEFLRTLDSQQQSEYAAVPLRTPGLSPVAFAGLTWVVPEISPTPPGRGAPAPKSSVAVHPPAP